jgi:hypothetical protein
MAVNIVCEMTVELSVKAPYKKVFDTLSDVPGSAVHYPKVDKLIDEGDGVYRWEMEKIGIGSFFLQTIYASKYISNPATGVITWTPVKGVGNSLVTGDWKIKDNKKSTSITMDVHGEFTIPAPGLMKMVLTPLVKSEFEKMTHIYLANLTKFFGGAA